MKYLQNTREIDGITIRHRKPTGPGPFPLILMLHGWTGDEDVMWVFASRLPENTMLLAPRGLYPAPHGGFGWHMHRRDSWPWVDDFKPAIETLLGLLNSENYPDADFSQLQLLGFSQGAACAYAMALLYPMLITRLAGLSGFLPEGAAALARNSPLTGKRVFIAHGTQDDLVPVDLAREAVQVLQEAGAQVTYCEDDVGHKLSANCFRGLKDFFSQ